MKSKREQIENFLELSNRFDGSAEQFHLIVNTGMELAGLSLDEAAEKLDTAPGTVGRWQHGKAAPVEFIRQEVVDFFAERVKNG